MENFNKTNLTVTITGTSVDEEGLMRLVDAKYEHVRALYVGALRIEDGEAPLKEAKLSEVVVGQFQETMWANLMLRMLDCAKLHGEDALGALEMAVTEFLDKWEGKK